MNKPYLDCPQCPECKLKTVITTRILDERKRLHCTACGHIFKGTDVEYEQATRADLAWEKSGI